jgi:hypothetical protein
MIRYKTVIGAVFPEYSGYPSAFDKALNDAVGEGWELVKFEVVPKANFYSDTKAVALMRKDFDD